MIVNGASRRSVAFWSRHLVNDMKNDRAELIWRHQLASFFETRRAFVPGDGKRETFSGLQLRNGRRQRFLVRHPPSEGSHCAEGAGGEERSAQELSTGRHECGL